MIDDSVKIPSEMDDISKTLKDLFNTGFLILLSGVFFYLLGTIMSDVWTVDEITMCQTFGVFLMGAGFGVYAGFIVLMNLEAKIEQKINSVKYKYKK